jgi:hypothetical protein
MNRNAWILVVLLTGSATPGCRDDVVEEPGDEASVGQEIEEGLHDADDAIDEGLDEDA